MVISYTYSIQAFVLFFIQTRQHLDISLFHSIHSSQPNYYPLRFSLSTLKTKGRGETKELETPLFSRVALMDTTTQQH